MRCIGEGLVRDMAEASVVTFDPAALAGIQRLQPVRATRAELSRKEEAVERSAGGTRRGVWALGDQAVVSLGNCATNVVLARSMNVGQFGLFAILLEVMIFLNSLQAAVIVYPLTVKGAKIDSNGLRRLAGMCLLLTAILSLPLGCTMIGAAGALRLGNLSMGILAGCALIAWQAQETLRRAIMSQGGFKQVLPGDIVSYLGQAIAMLGLAAGGGLTVNRAFAVMGITSLLAVALQAWQIGVRLPRFGEMLASVKDFWNMGRWVLLGNLTAILTTLSLSWTMAYYHGVDGVGQFQALAGVLKLSNPLMLALSGLIVPAAARAMREGGLRVAERVAFKYAMQAAMFVAPYYLGLMIVPSFALSILYGKSSPFTQMADELRVFILSYSALFIAQVIGCFLNGIEQSKRSFIAQIAQTAATVLVALPLTAMYGLPGLLVGWLSANVVLAASYVSMLRKVERPGELEELEIAIKHEMRESSATVL